MSEKNTESVQQEMTPEQAQTILATMSLHAIRFVRGCPFSLYEVQVAADVIHNMIVSPEESNKMTDFQKKAQAKRNGKK